MDWPLDLASPVRVSGPVPIPRDPSWVPTHVLRDGWQAAGVRGHEAGQLVGVLAGGSISQEAGLTWTPDLPGFPSPAHRLAISRGRGQDTLPAGDGHSTALGKRHDSVVIRAGAQPSHPPKVQRPGNGSYSPAPAPLRPGAQTGTAETDFEEVPLPRRPGWDVEGVGGWLSQMWGLGIPRALSKLEWSGRSQGLKSGLGGFFFYFFKRNLIIIIIETRSLLERSLIETNPGWS